MAQRPVCLSVGGSDSCAGAGIQADLRVFEALDVHGCSAITALTAQNPDEILTIQPSSITQFKAELEAITSFYDVACFKTGMLFDAAHVDILLPYLQDKPLVVDPVCIASSGKLLFEKRTAQAAYEKLIPQATLWTPNLQEAAFFLGAEIEDPVEAVSALLLKYKTPVLLKGGHSAGNVLRDIFCDLDGSIDIFEHPKLSLSTQQTHGTGCRLASSIASFLAKNEPLCSAANKAHQWLQHDLNHN